MTDAGNDVIGSKIQRWFFYQWEAQAEPIVISPNRGAGYGKLLLRNSDWFIALFAPVVIGRSTLVLFCRQSFENRSHPFVCEDTWGRNVPLSLTPLVVYIGILCIADDGSSSNHVLHVFNWKKVSCWVYRVCGNDCFFNEMRRFGTLLLPPSSSWCKISHPPEK